MASITSVNDVRAMDWSYSVFSVVTRNTGCLPFTDQMACCASARKPSVAVRLERIANMPKLTTAPSLPPQMY